MVDCVLNPHTRWKRCSIIFPVVIYKVPSIWAPTNSPFSFIPGKAYFRKQVKNNCVAAWRRVVVFKAFLGFEVLFGGFFFHLSENRWLDVGVQQASIKKAEPSQKKPCMVQLILWPSKQCHLIWKLLKKKNNLHCYWRRWGWRGSYGCKQLALVLTISHN